MSKHDDLTLSGTMNYCRGNLVKGCDHKDDDCVCKPIIVSDFTDKIKKYTDATEWVMDVWEERDGSMHPVRLQCVFGNSKGKAKASGARAVLEIYR